MSTFLSRSVQRYPRTFKLGYGVGGNPYGPPVSASVTRILRVADLQKPSQSRHLWHRDTKYQDSQAEDFGLLPRYPV